MKNMEDLPVPDPELSPDQNLKKTILNTQTSARIGIPLLILPGILLISMILKEELGINLGIINAITELIGNMDKSPYTGWLSPLIFLLLPLVAIIIFLLSITHFSYNKENYILQINIKFRTFNIVLLLLAGAILGTITLYLILENLNHFMLDKFGQPL